MVPLAGRKQLTGLQSPIGLLYVGGPPASKFLYLYRHAALDLAGDSKKQVQHHVDEDGEDLSEHEVVTNTGNGVAYLPAYLTQRTPVMYYIQQDRWSSTVTPRLLLQAGYSRDDLDYNSVNQAGIYQTPFTPAWYTA